MAENLSNFNGCPIIVYNDAGDCIAKATIIEYDRKERSIRISDELRNIKPGARLGILLIHQNGAIEFSGTARSIIAGSREISLYNYRDRKGRAAKRNPINMSVTINSMISDSKLMTFPEPYRVYIDNISTSGAHIRASTMYFFPGTVLEITINIAGQNTVLQGRVVREKYNDDGTFNFGVNFIDSSQVS